MKYRFYGDKLQIVKYELTVQREYEGKEYTETYTVVTDDEKEQILKQHSDAVIAKIDNTGYEWLDGMEFTQEQLRAGELDRAIEMGQDAYMALKNVPTQDEINAMLMLQIAELKAGGANE